MKNEFYDLIKDIIKTDDYQSMKNIKHHRYTNAYMHSIRVAYLCYRVFDTCKLIKQYF